MKSNNQKIIVIVGPTSSGKTALAVKLALAINGEIVSADSRQVYKYMDVGTGKDLPDYLIKIPSTKHHASNKYQFETAKIKNINYFKIPYHLIDVAHPNTLFDLAKWLKKAQKAIIDIQKRGRTPIVCGGTGLYAQALVDGYDLSAVGPNNELRGSLEGLSLEKLQKQLKKLDANKFKALNNSDKNNKRRLIRGIEVAKGKKHEAGSMRQETGGAYLVFGINWPREVLRERIYKRLIDRLDKENMIGEVESLHKEHRVPWEKLINFGLEYRYITYYLRGEMSYGDMVEQLAIAIGQFSKRQMTWYRRWERQGRKIYWVKNFREIKRIVSQ